MVLILSFCLDVEVHLGRVTQTFKEMEEHLCRHLTDTLPLERGIPYKPGTTAEIECH